MTRTWLVFGGALVVLGGIVLIPLIADAPAEPREIVLIARGISFYSPSNPGVANPVIRVAPGEKVRLVLQNEDEGIRHDLTVPDWDAEIGALESGASGSIVTRVPRETGQTTYVCALHGVMMKGTIQVEKR
jgi:hypothetical protein